MCFLGYPDGAPPLLTSTGSQHPPAVGALFNYYFNSMLFAVRITGRHGEIHAVDYASRVFVADCYQRSMMRSCCGMKWSMIESGSLLRSDILRAQLRKFENFLEEGSITGIEFYAPSFHDHGGGFHRFFEVINTHFYTAAP
jgi:hypothetical protein